MKSHFIYSALLVALLAGCASSQTSGVSSSGGCSSCQAAAQAQSVMSTTASTTSVVPVAQSSVSAEASSTPTTQKDEGIVKVKIETTMGVIEANLFANEVPKTVENFVKLAEKGFYDGIIFHRVIPDFMVQTGDPTGTGMGGPGYQFADEFSPKLKHTKAGIFSMANSGPNTNGSQFFITVAATPWLDNRHSVFGEVTSGLDIVKQISMVNRDRQDRPVKDIKMTKVSIVK